jgi:hypothetical protein
MKGSRPPVSNIHTQATEAAEYEGERGWRKGEGCQPGEEREMTPFFLLKISIGLIIKTTVEEV